MRSSPFYIYATVPKSKGANMFRGTGREFEKRTQDVTEGNGTQFCFMQPQHVC
jgi:hypothetical protein